MNKINSVKEAIHKAEHFCAYQERCHSEVIQKLKAMGLDSSEIDSVVVYLIEQDYLNESRFACCFARGKHRIKSWGRIRITNELKFRNISSYNIKLALKEISDEEYAASFDALALRNWNIITISHKQKRRKKFCDYLLRKGYESNLVYEKVTELENMQP